MKYFWRTALTIVLLLCTIHITAGNSLTADTTSARILADIREYFNTDNKDALYLSANEYRVHALKVGNIRNYYKGWETEILYDVNFNRFYQAMKKTQRMSEEMHKRGDREYYYNATYLIGVIHSLKGNTTLAEEHFRKALTEASKSDSLELISIYMDLANVMMDKEPKEAVKYIDMAVDMAEQKDLPYQYSDAVAFKTIVAFVMHDWETVKQCHKLYTDVEKKAPDLFSQTFFKYATIAMLTANEEYEEAVKMADELTNIDKYKFKMMIFEAAKDTAAAYNAQKEYTAIKDSITQDIQSVDLQSAAHDLAVSDALSDARRNKAINIILVIIMVGACLFISILLYSQKKRKEYTEDLKRKNEELTIAQDKANEAEKMKLSIMKNMSHEIRSPLNVISGFSQVIGNPDFSMSDSVRADIAAMVKKSTESIVKILNELLDISDSNMNIDKSKLGIVPVGGFCQAVADTCRKSVENGVNVVFNNHLDEDTCIKTDKEKLSKALECLLENARKFTDEGTICINCQRIGSNVEISISDTGCGIDDNERDKIFDHFYKGDKYKDGIGLGLPLAKRIINQLDGEISLDNSYTNGARFIVSLPLWEKD